MKLLDSVRPAGDLPSRRDLLGYKPYADVMARMLSDPSLETPYTVGIYGPWGSGKSTFMTLLAEALGRPTFEADDERTPPSGPPFIVQFRPWQFDHRKDVWKALIYTIIQNVDTWREASEGAAGRQSETINRIVTGLGRLVIDTALRISSDDKMRLDDVSRAIGQNERDVAHFLNRFRGEFKSLIAEALDDYGPDERLFVFVDDLDRCTPKSVVEVLEAIKLFLDFKRCVFVLAIDQELVRKGIEIKYENNPNFNGRDYLEKLVQLPFNLPPVAHETFRNYVRVCSHDESTEPQIVELISVASEDNPRRVKRILNCLDLVSTTTRALVHEGHVTPEQASHLSSLDRIKLTFLLILQIRHPLSFRWAATAPDQILSIRDSDVKNIIEALSRFEIEMGVLPDWTRDLLVSHRALYGDRLGPVELCRALKYLTRPIPNGSDKGPTSGLAMFSDAEELRAYAGITGAVDESKLERSVMGVTTEEVVDSALAAATGAEVPAGGEQMAPAPIENPLLDEGEQVVELWRSLRSRGLLSFLLKPLLIESDMQELASRVIVFRQGNYAERLREADYRGQKVMAQLRGITPEQIVRVAPSPVALRNSAMIIVLAGISWLVAGAVVSSGVTIDNQLIRWGASFPVYPYVPAAITLIGAVYGVGAFRVIRAMRRVRESFRARAWLDESNPVAAGERAGSSRSGSVEST